MGYHGPCKDLWSQDTRHMYSYVCNIFKSLMRHILGQGWLLHVAV